MAEHGPHLRPDLAGIVLAAPASLAQVDREEDGEQADDEQELDHRAGDAAVGEETYSCESSHNPPTV